MLLKKQTVWLLTMLSLVFVLSVYYFLGGQTDNNQMAGTEPASSEYANQGGDEDTAGTDGDDATDEAADATSEDGNAVVKYISTDETFAALRLDLEDIRSKHRAELRDRMASTELPAEEISKAADQLNTLALTQKELALESMIRARKDVDDALVRVTDGQIRLTIKAEEPSAKMANEIYLMVRQEFQDVRNENVAFEFNTADAGE